VVVAATMAAALVRADGTPANSAPTAAKGIGVAAPGPEASVGVGGVGSPSSSPTGAAGSPNVTDPRQTGPGVVTNAPSAGGPTATPTVVVTTPPPEPVDGSREYLGNNVTVRCDGVTATITGSTPATDWTVGRDIPGPAELVKVRFRSQSVEPFKLTFKATCVNGAPDFVVRSE
jgi:hypothetical protein